jgi:hypothetical protein
MPAIPTMMPSPMHAGAAAEIRDERWWHAKRQRSFGLAFAAALGVAACGDIKITPVDHSCPVVNACEHAGGR